MSVALLCAVSPYEVSNGTRFLKSNRTFDQSIHRNYVCNERIKRGGGKQRWSSRYSCLGGAQSANEQMVYDMVSRQAALTKKQLTSTDELQVKKDIQTPQNLGFLSEAYDRCREVCAKHTKEFFLGTLLVSTPEGRRALWAIAVWGRRTDELVDGPNASHITPTDLDRWEDRLEDIFNGRPFDMLDAALSDTVSKFPVDIQLFRNVIEGMRMDLRKSRYSNFDELYVYCYRIGGTFGLASVPILGIAPESKATIESIYSSALALAIANQLTNVLRDVGDDARRGRVYLPQDELAQAGLSDEDIFAGKVTDKWRIFMKEQIQRVKKFYDEGEKGVTELSAANRWTVLASSMLGRKILDEIEANDYNNFTRRANVSKPKALIALPIAYAKSLLS